MFEKHVVPMDSVTRSCEGCGSAENTKQCGGCGQVAYCSVQCQKTDWKRHKPECRKRPGKSQEVSSLEEYCELCKSKVALKKCGACFCVSYCSQYCQEVDWKRHKQTCININLPNGAEIAKKISEEFDRFLTNKEKLAEKKNKSPDKQKENVSVKTDNAESGNTRTIAAQNSTESPSSTTPLQSPITKPETLKTKGEDLPITNLSQAQNVIQEMFPERTVVSNFGLVPTELCGFRLCQGQQILVAAIAGCHPEKKHHAMMINDEDNVSSFISFHVPSIVDPMPCFKWEDLKPGNVLAITDPCFQAFPGGFLGLVIDDKADVLILHAKITPPHFYDQDVLHSSTYHRK